MDNRVYATDYETYREIMPELLHPIQGRNVDGELLVRLYQSKLVYLENLRIQCFREINAVMSQTQFTPQDHELIVEAIRFTKAHIKSAILAAIQENIHRRHAVSP